MYLVISIAVNSQRSLILFVAKATNPLVLIWLHVASAEYILFQRDYLTLIDY